MSVLERPVAPAFPETSTVLPGELWRLTVEQYHRMVESGILGEDDPVELLQGLLVRKMAKNPPHRFATRRTREMLERLLPAGWFVDAQEPITTAHSEPEPDLAVIRGAPRQYAARHPGPEDVGLVVEVADSSLERDRTVKKRVYASASIPTYWIVNLIDRRVEVYTDPTGPSGEPDYRSRVDILPDGEVSLLLDGADVGRIAVRELLP